MGEFVMVPVDVLNKVIDWGHVEREHGIKKAKEFANVLAAAPKQEAEPVEMKARFAEIEREICEGKHTAASVFTQMRTAALYAAPQPVQQPDKLRFSSACEISGPKHPEYVKGYEAAMEVKAREQQPIPTSERLRDALVSLVAVSRRYLPDYDEHPEIQKADAALEHAGSDGFPIDELIASIVCDAIEASRRIRMAFEAGDIAQAIEAQQQGEIKRRYSDKILYAIGMTMPADPEGGAE